MKALVVDDDRTTRLVLQKLLSPYGEVHRCVDGAEAVQAAGEALDHGTSYDLICLDLMMSRMSGLDALKLIREEEERHGCSGIHASKVIITTASGDDESISSAFRELCDAYLLKPIDGTKLLNLVCCLCPIE